MQQACRKAIFIAVSQNCIVQMTLLAMLGSKHDTSATFQVCKKAARQHYCKERKKWGLSKAIFFSQDLKCVANAWPQPLVTRIQYKVANKFFRLYDLFRLRHSTATCFTYRANV